MKKAKGSVDEFTQAYMEYYSQVFSSILTKVGNAEDARDLCQEVFLIFFDKFEKIENKRAWLYGTLRNVVYRHYAKKDPGVDIDEVFNDVGLTFTNGFRDTRIIISEALEQIECGEDERTMLDLIATHNFTYGNAAGVLGLTRRQVEYKYGQLVKRILEYLNSKGIKDIAELL
ncbi:MAG: hypothetical protein A2176_11335 [Spirochaetes bacterium RBG_13_51_14]|nr:MAG: hypothetical protein A2176_11335 [Spirochaetes bacterium RBG_13_51_14]